MKDFEIGIWEGVECCNCGNPLMESELSDMYIHNDTAIQKGYVLVPLSVFDNLASANNDIAKVIGECVWLCK